MFFGDEKAPEGYQHYEKIIEKGSLREPGIEVDEESPWAITCTSGTTVNPKGVARSHRSFIAHNWLRVANFGFDQDDIALLVMPTSHITHGRR